ncbi:MAG: DUF3830 family protein [Gemmatimonadetes bacterium]|nr:DUF3830 family protein [Gemmatimonadota bacterium]
MPRRIRLSFVNEDVSVEAEMLEDEAPRTCQAVWDALPLVEEGIHAVYSGSEIAYFLSEDMVIPPENLTSCTLPGDICYYRLESGLMHGLLDGITELCWFDGRDGRPNMPDGPVSVNLFARMVGDASEFFEVCYRIRREGMKRVRIEQVV